MGFFKKQGSQNPVPNHTMSSLILTEYPPLMAFKHHNSVSITCGLEAGTINRKMRTCARSRTYIPYKHTRYILQSTSTLIHIYSCTQCTIGTNNIGSSFFSKFLPFIYIIRDLETRIRGHLRKVCTVYVRAVGL